MAVHVNQKTGELSSPDAIVARAREIDEQLADMDERIDSASKALKHLKDAREDLVRELRAVVRPVPLFDQPPQKSIYGDTTVSITGPDGATHDVTDAMKSIEKKRH